MLDGVFHNGLDRECRDAEKGIRRVKLHEELPLVPCLFYREISPRVLQLLREGDRPLLGDGCEVALQIAGKIFDHALRLLGVLGAEIIDAHQCVVDEMRPHLQNGNARPLPRGLILLLRIAANQPDQKQQFHQRALDIRRCEEADQKDDPLCPGQLFPTSENGKQDDRRNRDHQDPIENAPLTEPDCIIRRDVDLTGEKPRDLCCNQNARQRALKRHDRAFSPAFAAAAEQIRRYEQGRDRDEQRGGADRRAAERKGHAIKQRGAFQQVEDRDDNRGGQDRGAQPLRPTVHAPGDIGHDQSEDTEEDRRRLQHLRKAHPLHHSSPPTG